jgi:hypothetical protein
MTITRRSFLTLIGAAAAGVAVARIPEAAPRPTLSDGVKGIAVDPQLPMTLHFLDTNMREVGPVFELPNDWWSVAQDGAAYLKSAVTVESWSGPACSLWGIELRRGGQWVFRGALTWLGGGAVCAADVVSIPCISLSMGGDRVSAAAKRAAVGAMLGLPEDLA